MLPEIVRVCCKTRNVRGQSLRLGVDESFFSDFCFSLIVFWLFVFAFCASPSFCIYICVRDDYTCYIYSIVLLPEGGNIQKYPAYYEPVVAVAATDNNRVATSFTNYGEWINISAPGEQVLSTINNNGYGRKSGTSMACPHVTGTYIIYSYVYIYITPKKQQTTTTE